MRTLPYLLAAGLLAALTACGGKPPPAPSNPNVSSPGTGNGALTVTATVDSSTDVQNSTDPAQFETTYTFIVWKGNAPVETATLHVYRGGSSFTVPYTGIGGVYQIKESGIPTGVVSFDVDAGSDYVHGVARTAPGLHVFGVPVAGNIYPANTAMTAQWTKPLQADGAHLHIRDFDATVVDDGSQDVPASDLDAKSDATARLDRTNELMISGATGGSKYTLTVHQQLKFTLQ